MTDGLKSLGFIQSGGAAAARGSESQQRKETRDPTTICCITEPLSKAALNPQSVKPHVLRSHSLIPFVYKFCSFIAVQVSQALNRKSVGRVQI